MAFPPVLEVKTMEEIDLEHTFTEDEVQDIVDWIESLTLIELAALKHYWEGRPADVLQ